MTICTNNIDCSCSGSNSAEDLRRDNIPGGVMRILSVNRLRRELQTRRTKFLLHTPHKVSENKHQHTLCRDVVCRTNKSK